MEITLCKVLEPVNEVEDIAQQLFERSEFCCASVTNLQAFKLGTQLLE